jgi:hypothetical protein
MRTLRLSLILPFILFTVISVAQINDSLPSNQTIWNVPDSKTYPSRKFKPGFIITNLNDTLRGEILYSSKSASSKLCIFRSNGSAEVYRHSPTDIKSYRFDEGGYYSAKNAITNKVLQPWFYEYLIKGKVNAYYKKDETGNRYFIETEKGDFVELTETQETIKMNRSIYYKPSAYKGKLKYAVSGSPSAIKLVDETQHLTQENLILILKEYYKDICDSGKCISYEKELKSVVYKFDVTGGIGFSRYNFGSKIYSTYDPAPNFGLNFSVYNLIAEEENLFFRMGVDLQNNTNTSFQINQENTSSELFMENNKRYYLNADRDEELIDLLNYTTSYHVNLKALSVRVPITLNYSLILNNKNRLNFGAGFAAMYNITQNKEFQYMRFVDEFGQSIIPFLFGYKFETDYRYEFKKSALEFRFSYNHYQSLKNINQFLRLSCIDFSGKLAYVF